MAKRLLDKTKVLDLASEMHLESRKYGSQIDDPRVLLAAAEVALMREQDGHEALKKVEKARNRENSLKLRKPNVTKQQVTAFRDAYVRDNGKEHGWKQAAAKKFKVARKTITARMDAPNDE